MMAAKISFQSNLEFTALYQKKTNFKLMELARISLYPESAIGLALTVSSRVEQFKNLHRYPMYKS